MSPTEDPIDALYNLPLGEFTAARNALAKTLKGEEAARVKRLEKPTLVPWAVNQLYWRERRTFDRLMASGRALRNAQIAALKGRSGDLRAATADHRAALADALATTLKLAAQSEAHPQPGALSRMLEALSLSTEPPAAPGRLTEALQPAGFEALAGVTPLARASAAPPAAAPARGKTTTAGKPAAKGAGHAAAAAAAAARHRRDEEVAARNAARADVHARERDLDRARAAFARAQAQADGLRQQLETAERTLADARAAVKQAEHELARSEAVLKRP